MGGSGSGLGGKSIITNSSVLTHMGTDQAATRKTCSKSKVLFKYLIERRVPKVDA